MGPNPEKEAYNKIIALESKYPDGTPWSNNNYYAWKGGTYSGGYGCAGFAFMLSDAAFGSKKAVKHRNKSNIRVGDILRLNNDGHSVIVLEVRENSVIVAEGNISINGGTPQVLWGREIPKTDICRYSGDYIMTRW